MKCWRVMVQRSMAALRRGCHVHALRRCSVASKVCASPRVRLPRFPAAFAGSVSPSEQLHNLVHGPHPPLLPPRRRPPPAGKARARVFVWGVLMLGAHTSCNRMPAYNTIRNMGQCLLREPSARYRLGLWPRDDAFPHKLLRNALPRALLCARARACGGRVLVRHSGSSEASRPADPPPLHLIDPQHVTIVWTTRNSRSARRSEERQPCPWHPSLHLRTNGFRALRKLDAYPALLRSALVVRTVCRFPGSYKLPVCCLLPTIGCKLTVFFSRF